MMTVMIVDDERIAREGLRDLVDWSALGLQVSFCASNGRQALQWLDEHRVDIVITDIKMPQMDGLELLRNMSERGFHSTTIILSGFNDFKYAQKAIQYGVLHYLLKPVHMDELQEVLQRAVEERQKGRTVFHIDPEQSARFQAQTRSRADEISEAICTAVCSGEQGCAERLCDDLRKLFEQENYPLDVFKKYAFSCIYHLVRGVSNFTGTEVSYLENVERLAILSVAGDFSEVADQLVQCVADLCAHLTALKKSQSNRIIDELLYILQHRYADSSLSLQTVADQLGLTPNYLSSLFKRQMGENFSDYLEKLRIEKACQLLRDVQYKVYQVADAVGYTDPRHFAKVFKAATGKTPLAYRNTAR